MNGFALRAARTQDAVGQCCLRKARKEKSPGEVHFLAPQKRKIFNSDDFFPGTNPVLALT